MLKDNKEWYIYIYKWWVNASFSLNISHTWEWDIWSGYSPGNDIIRWNTPYTLRFEPHTGVTQNCVLLIAPLPITPFNSPGSADLISRVYTHLAVLSESRITAKLIAEFQLNKWLVQINFALFCLWSKTLTELHTHCLNVSIKCIFHDFEWIRSITNWCIGICFSWFTGSSQSMAPAHELSLICWTLPNIQWQV